MNFKYLYIESKFNIENELSTILEVFSSIVSVKEYKSNANSITLYFNHEITMPVLDVIYNLVEDILIDLRVYESKVYRKLEILENDFLLVKRLLEAIPFHKYTYINNQIILKENLKSINLNIKKLIFGKYYNNTEILKTIKTYLECNQNMTNASKVLYLHRNTLNQRLEKFTYSTGFNVKEFKDAFLIYHLLK